MYELKKNGKVFMSKFVGTGPSSYKKRIYWAAVAQRLRNAALENLSRTRAYLECNLISLIVCSSTFRPYILDRILLHNLFLNICLLIKYVFVFLMKVVAYFYIISFGWIMYMYIYSCDIMLSSL